MATLSMVTIETYTSPWEANIARGLLESEGIPAFLFNEQQIWMNWNMSQALGGVRLQVSAEDRQRAFAVLSARDAGEYAGALNDLQYELPLRCPKCSSPDIEVAPSSGAGWSVVAIFLITGIVSPKVSDRWRCKACREVFQ